MKDQLQIRTNEEPLLEIKTDNRSWYNVLFHFNEDQRLFADAFNPPKRRGGLVIYE